MFFSLKPFICYEKDYIYIDLKTFWDELKNFRRFQERRYSLWYLDKTDDKKKPTTSYTGG